MQDNILNYDWLFNDLQSAAETDLISRRITSHLAIPQACPNPACQTFRPRPWTELIRTAESRIHAALIETRETYMRYGKTYHMELHPLSRVRHLEDPNCAVAHQQFTLETRPFINDSFFMPWRALYSGHVKIKAAVQNDYNLLPCSNAKRIGKAINDCRFEINKIEYLLNQLYTGINIFLTESRSLQNDKARRNNIVVAHFPATPPSKTAKPQRSAERKIERITSPFKETKLRADLEIKLDVLTSRLNLEPDSIVSTSMPLDESTGKTADVAFIEFQMPKQAKQVAALATAWGALALNKKQKRPVTFTRLTDVSRLNVVEMDEFRDADVISSRSQGAVDEMRRHIRQKSKEQLCNAEKNPLEYEQLSGSALQQHLAKRKTAKLLRRRMNGWGTKIIDKSDVHDDTRHLRHAVFRNAAYKTWLKRVEGFAEPTP
ncbi:hypothetical protein AC579_4809 [Pseudocercospora musae]|uniref:Uncharacterized protein n=1 Tax=Pseudocercospora musae TaxID=113226 RepID=A0A139II23_9PEZI|nr:hypothetical protein AC579_4809 [Pseudocercospora musae]